MIIGSCQRQFRGYQRIVACLITFLCLTISPLSSLAQQLVTRLDAPEAPNGLDGSHIVLWNSHGKYYNEKLKQWTWQRPRLYGTMEDVFTATFVLDFLTPMLENAGANVIIPRERDTSTEEAFPETKLKGKWAKEQIAVTKKSRSGAATASWNAEFETKGEKAVYVRYTSSPQAAPDALYRVTSLAGTQEFLVNQRIGSGIWVYLGTFPFDIGKQDEPVVELVAVSDYPGSQINAGEVKIGGGMGTIKRGGLTSGVPRWCEGALYYLEAMGMPDSVIHPVSTDYNNDIQSRGLYVNYLCGSSPRNPGQQGLGVPIDLSLALHTDAGVARDSLGTIGTLAIVSTAKDTLGDGTPRTRSIDLGRMVQTEVVQDIRNYFNPDWQQRKLLNKPYIEANFPRVPSVLVELLSHQNFNDMILGWDPDFQFTAARSLYKGILKFLADRDDRDYVVQPLPVSDIAISGTKGNYKLTWKATEDADEPSARPEYYIVYEKQGSGEFQELAVIKTTSLSLKIKTDRLYSYQVVAVNSGGSSFPSESLSLGYVNNDKPQVLVVNGFYSGKGPQWFENQDSIGFLFSQDHGAGYKRNISFVGDQKVFKKNCRCISDNNAGTGFSYGDYVGKIIGGNTFNYPETHGQAILDAGYSFISSSKSAFVKQNVKADIIDIILGKQGGINEPNQALTPDLRKAINMYCGAGKSLLISGCYIGSELFGDTLGAADASFAYRNLGLIWYTPRAAETGEVQMLKTPLPYFKPATYYFNQALKEDSYAAESPESFLMRDECTEIMQYPENSRTAGTAFASATHRAITLGFPFELVQDENSRTQLMKEFLSFLTLPNKVTPKVDTKKTSVDKKKKKKKKK